MCEDSPDIFLTLYIHDILKVSHLIIEINSIMPIKKKEKPGNDVVLIVEDERGLNSLIQKTLQHTGFKTEGVFNGKETISRMSEANVKMMPFSIERVLKDISKENKLAESEERIILASQEWRTTFDAIADFVSVHDKDFKITKANKAFAESLGMDVKNMIGRYCYDVIHHQSEPLADCPHMEMLVTKETVTRDIYNEAMGRHLMVSVSPIFDKDGELQGSVYYMKDITKIKESEEELKNRVDDLEKFYEMAVNRELRMKELKRELKKLKGESSGERAEVS
jgi:PAS domain S-box-containing protein